MRFLYIPCGEQEKMSYYSISNFLSHIGAFHSWWRMRMISLPTKARVGLASLLALSSSCLVAAEEQKYSIWNLRRGVTDVSQEVYDLHMLVVWAMTIVSIIVFGAILYAVVRFRKSKHPVPAKFSHSTTVEIIWTVIPMLILAALSVDAIKLLLKVEDASKADMSVVVTGHQWYWQYQYIDEGKEFINANGEKEYLGFFSRLSTPREQWDLIKDEAQRAKPSEYYLREVDNPLVIPAGKKVRLLVTAPPKGVIHSWWVQDFSVKLDAIPGVVRETWTKVDQPGTYRGVCAELCGKDHGYMPIVVEVKEQAEFDRWLAEQKEKKKEEARIAAEEAAKTWDKPKLMALGKKVYMDKCSVCHQPEGQGLATFPALSGSDIAIKKEHLADHINIIIHGKGAMPPQGALLSDADIAAVVTYERNAWGNDTGDIVQPADIKQYRDGQ